MAEKRIDQLTVEATTLADGDFLVAQDLSDAQTVKVSVANARTVLAPSLQQAYDAGPAPEIATDTTRGAVTITTPGLGPALALRADLGSVVDGLWLHAGGLSSTEAIEIGPEPPSSGNGQALRLWGGTAASGADGGTVSINAGDGATPGDILIGAGTVNQIESGTGTTPWTHSGDLTVTGTLTAADGGLGTPSIAWATDPTTGFSNAEPLFSLPGILGQVSGAPVLLVESGQVRIFVPGSAAKPTLAIDNEGNGLFRGGGGSGGLAVASGGEEVAYFDSVGPDETAMLLRYDPGTGPVLERVTVGAADSGGAGFRVLRVPN